MSKSPVGDAGGPRHREERSERPLGEGVIGARPHERGETDMEEKVEVSRRSLAFLGFVGFAGCMGFKAFQTHSPYDLFMLSFFSFFAYFRYFRDWLKYLGYLG